MTNSQDRLGDKLDEAQLRYLRAADHAQNGSYEEAEAEFIAALALNPELHTARFQLGLLQLSSGKPDLACASWSSLHKSTSPEELHHFSLGLEALIKDDFHSALEHLAAGISLNQTNHALNNDMVMVIGKIQAIINSPENARDTSADHAADAVRTDFSLYGNKG